MPKEESWIGIGNNINVFVVCNSQIRALCMSIPLISCWITLASRQVHNKSSFISLLIYNSFKDRATIIIDHLFIDCSGLVLSCKQMFSKHYAGLWFFLYDHFCRPADHVITPKADFRHSDFQIRPGSKSSADLVCIPGAHLRRCGWHFVDSSRIESPGMGVNGSTTSETQDVQGVHVGCNCTGRNTLERRKEKEDLYL